MDRYAVIGHPIAHSKSPRIHAAFARQTGQDISYEALLAPIDGFAAAVAAFRAAGGRGVNVTVPFKLDAHALANRLSARARAAGAVNTLVFDGDDIFGDNTDGAGLVRDLTVNLDCDIADRRVLLLGAGGAARGVLLPLIDARPATLTLANRRADKARELCAACPPRAGVALDAGGLGEPGGLAGRQFDIVINATSASLAAEVPDLPAGIYAPGALAYDMMYGAGDTAYMIAARAAGATRLADGLGMLVEQAAESFALWRGMRPETTVLLAELRDEMEQH
ncbi:MAG: shikimate dehydrogenase [Azoarcus sp.]|jgi:shikimate dehydrogenase|nr:shikimate dehydrogenase [Azoarcus sp.]